MHPHTHTTAPDFLLVDEHVARNPVAQAIAKSRLTIATRDFQTRLYLLQEGERVTADVEAAAKVVAVALAVLSARQQGGTPEARVMAGGMSALAQCSERGFAWHARDAVAIDQALAIAVCVYRGATPVETQRAHLHVNRIEREAMAARARGAGA